MSAKLPKILLLTTGGTLASAPTDKGLAPQLSGEEIMDFVPEIKKIAELQALPLMNIDSTNMEPRKWLRISAAIEENYERYDAFVIIHGTDTLAYTAAALTYLIQDSRKPIVITGSQQSIALRDTDARANLKDAVRYAADPEAAGVKVVFNGQVMLGSRVRKTHTKSYRAFLSIDYPNVAMIRRDKIYHFISEKPSGPVRFYHHLDSNVAVLKLVPGLWPSHLLSFGRELKALILEGFGSGGLPDRPSWDLVSPARELLEQGKILVMSTQVQHEGSDMATYTVGHALSDYEGMMEAFTLTPEALFCKLMWILAKTSVPREVRKLLLTPIDHDLLG